MDVLRPNGKHSASHFRLDVSVSQAAIWPTSFAGNARSPDLSDRVGCGDRSSTGLTGSDTDRFLNGAHKNLTITDLAGVGGFHDRVLYSVQLRIVYDDLNLHFWQKIDSVFTAPIDLSVSFLASKSLHFRDGHSLDSNLGERLFDVLEFKGLNNGFYFLHVSVSGL
jgi:hypothetical protein